MIATDSELIAALAARTGLRADDLFAPVSLGRIRDTFSYPLDDPAAERLVQRFVGELTRAAEVGIPAEADPASRYVWLHEMVAHYQSAETRTVVIRVSHAGQMPAWRSGGDGYDPLARGWNLDAEEHGEELVRQSQTWQWWKRVKAAGIREEWLMPSPYAAASSDVPIDRALDDRDRTGNEAAYRAALKQIRDANYRDVDA